MVKNVARKFYPLVLFSIEILIFINNFCVILTFKILTFLEILW